MLVSEKQDWYVYEEQTAPVTAPSPKTSNLSRARCLLFMVLVAAMAMFITVRSEAIIRAGYDLVKMKAQVASLETENDLLRLDIAKLKSPQRIQQIAAKELGMVVPPQVYLATNTPKPAGQIAESQPDKSVIGQVMDMLRIGKVEASKGR